MIGRLEKTVINCADPSELAEFYCALLGMKVQQKYEDWATIGSAPGMRELAFQRTPNFQRPQWPDPNFPNQMHLDVRVADPDVAGAKVLDIGARRAVPFAPETGYRVFLDPAGHPFFAASARGHRVPE